MVLVDADDQEIGVMEKLEAHEKGLMHRAFSVFLFNENKELLLQRRALDKYHSGGLWTNTCCSHPKPGENASHGAQRRLQEEMGITAPLTFKFSFSYKSEYENGLSEHEFDHVFFGNFSEEPKLNPEEAMDWEYVSLDNIAKKIAANPDQFTTWFKICLPKVSQFLLQ